MENSNAPSTGYLPSSPPPVGTTFKKVFNKSNPVPATFETRKIGHALKYSLLIRSLLNSGMTEDVLFFNESLSEFAGLTEILDENWLLSTPWRSEDLDELLEGLFEDVGRSHVDLLETTFR